MLVTNFAIARVLSCVLALLAGPLVEMAIALAASTAADGTLAAQVVPPSVGASRGRILKVGAGEEFAMPSAAAAVVQPGDTVLIAPGRYVDCAVWPIGANGLIVEGTGEGVVIADKVCQDKGVFVIQADDVTVRRLTFTGAAVPRNENGAGIRLEGRNLTVENSRFIGNENGILSGTVPDSRVVVRNSYFRGNGKCGADCAHGIYVGGIMELVIEGTEFVEQHDGHHVKSRAHRTELTGNTIHDGPYGNTSYLVDVPNGGDLIMRDNRLEKGPNSTNHTAAVSLAAEGNRNSSTQIVIENNVFINDMRRSTLFVRNLTGTPARLRGNRLTGDVKALEGPGG